ncbi:GNAT family N-acetyltransferase [Clostridium botulinum]|uniref:GNAT family N-acetyltransferase n=1 Tax=Clostridium botulinum TaxID=1491 RepID=UPI000773145D|nr:GNAT family N-acetyltransferase [Clostridium botulinum]MBY6810091.1 GNAT family N-acetyltransferase [Clostridium botulinum]MBY6823553.1 GNAT family N-acetyltransferase [Clostridium botulinum]MBY6833951.1 GNAT family N-acetyltransferase [Clostridium botulinum]MBY6972298.1 GNAT family N-acetyltransferase [Clostridium botulinum]MCS6104906.1 N-acetyltransferase [Clostridium botulinum]
MNLIFKKCDENDFEDFYILRTDEENIYWTGYDSKPNKSNLKIWYLNQLKRNDRILFIVRSDEAEEPVGYLYLDIVGDNNNIIETGHGVNSKYKGKGLGTEIIKFAIDYSRDVLTFIDEVDGWILEDNIGSIKNVLKNGYDETDDRKAIYVEKLDTYKTMKKYVYKIK